MKERIKEFLKEEQLEFYGPKESDNYLSLLERALSLNPHSTHTKKKLLKSGEPLFAVALDNLAISYIVTEEKAKVVDVELLEKGMKLRTQAWLDSKQLSLKQK